MFDPYLGPPWALRDTSTGPVPSQKLLFASKTRPDSRHLQSARNALWPQALRRRALPTANTSEASAPPLRGTQALQGAVAEGGTGGPCPARCGARRLTGGAQGHRGRDAVRSVENFPTASPPHQHRITTASPHRSRPPKRVFHKKV